MAKDETTPQIDETFVIDLRDPAKAALLAWLCPGAGHLYQRRYGKGTLFLVSILALYFFGLALGHGRVVYASWTETDKRWQYICQVCVGLPAIPALVQAARVFRGKDPLWSGFMAPPKQPVDPENSDELARWHLELASDFDVATLYTMIAGLLNVLVIYDALAGPFLAGDTSKKPGDGAANSGNN